MAMQMEIPASKLRPGKKAKIDSRKTDAPVDGLMRSIETHGVIVPLIVRKDGADMYDVIDGNRRLTALSSLFKRDKVTATAARVPCVVHEEGNPLELSLVVNLERANLHPVDKFEVFEALIKSGETVDALAQRYGMKIAEVRQALALARMAPEVREAWREGALSAEAAEAFVITSDRKAQVSALKRAGKSPTAWSVRRALLGERDQATLGSMLKFVGRAAYEKAGGEVNATLFSQRDGDDVFVSDPAKLREMARSKLSAECERLVGAGWKWAVPADEAPKDWAAWRRVHHASGNWTRAEMENLGCVVQLDWQGVNIIPGIAKPGDKIPTPIAKRKQAANGKEGKAAAKSNGGGVSNALARRLSRQFEEAVRDVVEAIPSGQQPPLLILLDARQVAQLADEKKMMGALHKKFDAEDYFGGVGKDGCIAALKELGRSDVVKPGKTPPSKWALVKIAAQMAKAKGWLPPQLRVGK